MSAVEQPAPSRTHRKPRKMGPFSRERSLMAVDGRTQAGRVLRGIEAQLLGDLGPKATVAQKLLARSAALKATRITLLTKRVVDEGTLADGTDPQTLAWMNGLRADLSAMGLLDGRGAPKSSREPEDEDDLAAYVRATKAGAQ